MTVYVVDACSFIASLAGEPGGDNFVKVIQEALDGSAAVKMNQINFLEVYYKIIHVYGLTEADKLLSDIADFPIEIITGMSADVFREAGRLKSKYKIPLGDAVAAAECLVNNGLLVTADHHDFEPLATAEKLKVHWIR
ncbi:MAG: PIN domain-containing protein [Treponema sp.]|jgi:predicted nucleic acid-binding protein|nr:PIN domain-containing protein [Treponema sp.]